jgi:cell shape-determining protein MreC
MKIESDVVQMHNRIHLLEQEEKRALRRIQETRQKADQILQVRHDQLKFKKQLDSTRKTILEDKLSRVKSRNMDKSPEGSPENFVSGSVLLAKKKI